MAQKNRQVPRCGKKKANDATGCDVGPWTSKLWTPSVSARLTHPSFCDVVECRTSRVPMCLCRDLLVSVQSVCRTGARYVCCATRVLSVLTSRFESDRCVYGYCCLPKSNEYVTCMVHPFFTQQNICSQWCDQVLCNHSQLGSQFMRGVHGYATQLVFVALVILHMFCQRTTRKNDLVEFYCEWRRGIATTHALQCQWIGSEAARKRDTPQWCQLTLQRFHFEKVRRYCSLGISSVLVGQMHRTPRT